MANNPTNRKVFVPLPNIKLVARSRLQGSAHSPNFWNIIMRLLINPENEGFTPIVNVDDLVIVMI